MFRPTLEASYYASPAKEEERMNQTAPNVHALYTSMRDGEDQLDVFDRLFNDFYNREYVKDER